MKHFCIILLSLSAGLNLWASEETERISELDQFWSQVSAAVKEGDFESYQKTCHPDAVLVSGTKKTAYPLAKALARWKQEFDDTQSGKMIASVEFRFDHRYGDETTAHESGMFLYSSQKAGEKIKQEFIHFSGLLVQKEGRWLLMMEYQESVGTEKEWQALN